MAGKVPHYIEQRDRPVMMITTLFHPALGATYQRLGGGFRQTWSLDQADLPISMMVMSLGPVAGSLTQVRGRGKVIHSGELGVCSPAC